MTEETFLKQIDPIPEHDYFYYVPADWSLGQNAFCRAYIKFTDQEDIFIFKDKFDGYVFVDTKGTEYAAVVEFAPFQGLPRNRSRKKDNKSNSMESDAHYISFVESLNTEQNEAGKQEAKLEFSYQFKDDKKITKTPLLEFLHQKKKEHRDEQKRKNDERKKRREDERQRKKNSVAKSIPAPIQEEESKILVDEDDIMVRTIKSRPIDRNRNNQKKDRDRDRDRDVGNKQSKNDENRDNRKSYRDRQERRQAERRKERDQRRNKNKDVNSKDSSITSVSSDKSVDIKNEDKILDNSVPSTVSTTAEFNQSKEQSSKPGVKKYSEGRKDRRARASGSSSQSNQNNDDKKDDSIIEQDSKKNSDESANDSKRFDKKSRQETQGERSRRESDERYARRIKNKDRPSIEIYRPKQKSNVKSRHGDENSEQGSDSPRRQSFNSDEILNNKRNESPKTSPDIIEKKLKAYEMSPDIPPFIPKSHQVTTVKIDNSENKTDNSTNN